MCFEHADYAMHAWPGILGRRTSTSPIFLVFLSMAVRCAQGQTESDLNDLGRTQAAAVSNGSLAIPGLPARRCVVEVILEEQTASTPCGRIGAVCVRLRWLHDEHNLQASTRFSTPLFHLFVEQHQSTAITAEQCALLPHS